MIESVRCEVFSNSYEPISVISGKRALVLFLKGKAHILTEHASYSIQTGDKIFPIPTQILLLKPVKSRPTTRVPAQLTQRNLFVRDKYTCQYCGRHRAELKKKEFLTRDHVHPQSKGGKDEWKNVVTACNKCNNRKADLTLGDACMDLNKLPSIPTVFEIWSKSSTKNLKRIRES